MLALLVAVLFVRRAAFGNLNRWGFKRAKTKVKSAANRSFAAPRDTMLKPDKGLTPARNCGCSLSGCVLHIGQSRHVTA